MSNLTSMQKLTSVVKYVHKSCHTQEWTKALTITILKELYTDYQNSNIRQLLPLRNLVVEITKKICDYIGASDTEARSLFYNLWLKVVYDVTTMSTSERKTFDMITTFVGKLTYTYQVVYETNNRYYHMYQYTFSNDDQVRLNAVIQDTLDIDDIAGGKSYTTQLVCKSSLGGFEAFVTREFGEGSTQGTITMPIRFAMLPCNINDTHRKLSQYLKQKTILEQLVNIQSAVIHSEK